MSLDAGVRRVSVAGTEKEPVAQEHLSQGTLLPSTKCNYNITRLSSSRSRSWNHLSAAPKLALWPFPLIQVYFMFNPILAVSSVIVPWTILSYRSDNRIVSDILSGCVQPGSAGKTLLNYSCLHGTKQNNN